jgi:hypothetical protein
LSVARDTVRPALIPQTLISNVLSAATFRVSRWPGVTGDRSVSSSGKAGLRQLIRKILRQIMSKTTQVERSDGESYKAAGSPGADPVPYAGLEHSKPVRVTGTEDG